MTRDKAMNGYTKVTSVRAAMRHSYFGYGMLYPTYFNWLHHFLLVGGNGYRWEQENAFFTYTETTVVKETKGKKIPKSWFTSPVTNPMYSLYPYSSLCLIGSLYNNRIPMTAELEKYVLDFWAYLEANPGMQQPSGYYHDGDAREITEELVRRLNNGLQ